jgi:hypothetical protein
MTQNSITIKYNLAPCPFCGKDDYIISKSKSNDGTITWFKLHHTALNRCSVSMLDSNLKTLIKRWNTREHKKEFSFAPGFQ